MDGWMDVHCIRSDCSQQKIGLGLVTYSHIISTYIDSKQAFVL